MRKHREQGLATVEFAIVGAALMIMIFGVFEVGRAYYTHAMLNEVTRRAARLASVCQISDPDIARLAIMNPSGDSSESRFITGLQPANVLVDYLDSNGAVVGDPGAAGFPLINYVRARITGFSFQAVVPFVSGLASLAMSNYAYVLPRESLGVPRDGALSAC
jgi:Flp pilus assembly protein TadG